MSRIVALFLGIFTLASAAQTIPPVPTQATHTEINDWLRSSDERLVAWGANFAAQNHDAAVVPQLSILAESWIPLPPQAYDAQGNYVPRTPELIRRIDAMTQVLDALIQLHGNISSQAIENLSEDFPSQALTLFARMTEPERTEFAEAIYGTRRGTGATYDWHALSHDRMVYLAAALLAKHPPQGFTSSLLGESTVVLKVSVTDRKQKAPGAFGIGTCGDSFASKPAPGWPQAWTYVVEQKWPQEQYDPSSVLVPGDPAITTRRAESSSSCSTLEWFSSTVRLRLARQEAGLPKVDLGQGSLQYDDLAYTGPKGYQSAMISLIAQHIEPFRQLASELQQNGFLSEEEARITLPRLVVQITDERTDKTDPLPHLSFSSPKIIFGDPSTGQKQYSALLTPF